MGNGKRWKSGPVLLEFDSRSQFVVGAHNASPRTSDASATFAAGSTSVLVRTAITDDALDEAAEGFTLTATQTAGTTTNTDETGRIVHFNRACESSTGRPRATVIGRPFADVFTPEAPSGDADASPADPGVGAMSVARAGAQLRCRRPSARSPARSTRCSVSRPK